MEWDVLRRSVTSRFRKSLLRFDWTCSEVLISRPSVLQLWWRSTKHCSKCSGPFLTTSSTTSELRRKGSASSPMMLATTRRSCSSTSLLSTDYSPHGPPRMCPCHFSVCSTSYIDVCSRFSSLPLTCRYECFSVCCELTHGGREICAAGVSENISTALAYGNKIQCNRM